MDVKRNIYDLCVNSYDTQIALVENQGMYHSIQESVVRLYDVGRRRDYEDDQVMYLANFNIWSLSQEETIFIDRQRQSKPGFYIISAESSSF